jgi:hypothetical protein
MNISNQSLGTRPPHQSTGCIRAGITVPLLAVALLGLTACSSTHQSRGVTESGFLGDYAQLQKGKGDQAKLVYIDPAADWTKYSKIMIEPVQLWDSEDPDSKLGKLSKENQEMLVSYLYTTLSNNLSKDFQIVEQAGPGVLVLRSAVTEAKKSRPVSNLISSIVPFGMALSLTKRVIFGTGLGVGEAQVEMELLDGQTKQRVAAAVDRRAGTKALRTKFDGSFGDVKLAFDYWAERLTTRLQEERTGAATKTEL